MNNSKQAQIVKKAFLCFLPLIFISCTATQAPQAVTPNEVSIRLPWIHKADFSGYYVAQQQGYYETENLKVTVNPVDLDIDAIDLVVSGEDQFGEIPGTALLEARAAGEPVVAVAMIYRRNFDIFISLAESNITTAEDMVGKKVGVTVGQEFPFQFLLNVADIAPSEIEKIENTDFTMRPLVQGDYDVMSGYVTDQPVTAKLQGYDINIISTDDYGVYIPGHVIFTTEEMVKNNPDVVRRFVQSTLKGFDEVMNDPGKGVEATLNVDETLDPDFEAGVLEIMRPFVLPDDNPIGYMNQEIWQQGIDVMAEQEIIPATLDAERVFTTEFLN